MKRLMFQFLLAAIFGVMSGLLNYVTFHVAWGFIPGGIIAGGLAVLVSDRIYDKLFVNKKERVRSVLEEMGEDEE